jgi:hypothetical protein
MKRTLEQNNKLHTLLAKTDQQKNKASLVFAFTEGRTESSSEMSIGECNSLIAWLQNLDKPRVDPADKMRKKILSICHDMNWELVSGKIDWDRLNNWLKKFGYLHKGLNEYTMQELPKLVTQFENLLKTFYAKK